MMMMMMIMMMMMMMMTAGRRETPEIAVVGEVLYRVLFMTFVS
eukprot:COSAG01_NODE_32162_length_585_cov_1.271605_2_plen_43_part_00